MEKKQTYTHTKDNAISLFIMQNQKPKRITISFIHLNATWQKEVALKLYFYVEEFLVFFQGVAPEENWN